MTDDRLIRFLDLIKNLPAVAMKTIAIISSCDHGPLTLAFIARRGGFSVHEQPRIAEVLVALQAVDFCRPHGADTILPAAEPGLFGELYHILRGVVLYQVVHKDKDNVQMIFTRPATPSKLVDALRNQGPYHACIEDTDSAFLRIAREARYRLVIVTPFIDKIGAEWIERLLLTAQPESVEKVLVIRDYDVVKDMLMHISGTLNGCRVKIYDYFIKHNDRMPPYETFHAKIVLGDDCQAYIGSANMVASSLDTSLEAGVLINGKSAVDVRRLVDAMLEVSQPIS